MKYSNRNLKSHFDSKTGRFTNRRPEMQPGLSSPLETFKIARKFLFSPAGDRVPPHELPEVKPDLAEFLKPNTDRVRYIWFGHSTFLVNFEGRIILFDPVFHSASPFSFMVRRFQKPILKLEELPKIDLIVISHDHYDHLDSKAMKFFASQKMKIITTLGVGDRLRCAGVGQDRITELDWWQEHQELGLKFVATPAQHFSGRGLFDRNKTLWCSFVVQSEKHRLYFSGDSGYDTHFKEIGDKYGPFDICFMENGQYNKLWRAIHMFPEDAVQAQIDLRGKWLVPVHWGMFNLSLHSWHDPIDQVEKLSKERGVQLMTPKIGQIIDIDQPPQFERWWKTLNSSSV